MEEKMNLTVVGMVLMGALMLLISAVGWLRLRNIQREITELKVEMQQGDSGLHERINMLNADMSDLYVEVEGAYEDIGRLIETNKLQSASIEAINKRLKSVEYVTDKILKQLEEKKEAEKKKATETPKINEEEVHEVYAESSGVGEYLGVYELTAYEYTGSPCANGNMPTVGYTVACNSLDIGQRIYIEGYGYYVVEDRGGMAGNVIDIYLGDADACIQFGRRTANVYLAN